MQESIKIAGGFELADVFPSVKFLHLISGTRLKHERMHNEAVRMIENIIKEHKSDKAAGKKGHDETEEDLVDILLNFRTVVTLVSL